MNVLVIYPYLPYPLDSGGKIRGHQILEALIRSHRVTLIAFGDTVDREVARRWPLAGSMAVPPIIVDNAGKDSLSTSGAKLRVLGPRPFWGLPSYMGRRDLAQMWNALAALPLGEYEVIHGRTFHMAPYPLALKQRYPEKRFVFDLDDVGSIVRLRRVRSAKLRWFSRWRVLSYVDFLRIRLFERVYLSRFDSVWICSEKDAALLSGWIGKEKPYVVPNVMDIGRYKDISKSQQARPIVIFVAEFSMDHNSRAALFLYEKIWPLVRTAVPEAELWLVGREPGPEILALDKTHGVTVTGSVPDVKPYLAQAAVAVAPLLVGGGTRVKILEAFAARVPVVATTIGAEGIVAENERNILIADDADDFASACVKLLIDPVLNENMRQDAFSLVRRNYNLDVLTDRVLKCYTALR